MTFRQLIPRLALILVFLAGAAFTYIESTYMRDHAASLGQKGDSVTFWMWFYRILAMVFFFAASFFAGSIFRR